MNKIVFSNDAFLDRIMLRINKGEFKKLGINPDQRGPYPEWFVTTIREIIGEPNPNEEGDHAISAFNHEIYR